MSNSQQLKLFCDRYCLDFPDFNIAVSNYQLSYNKGFICSIIWYNQLTFSGQISNSKESSIISALNILSNWISLEENFITLMQLKKNSMQI